MTARDLLRRIARDTGVPYEEIAKRINDSLTSGTGFLDSVHALVSEYDLDPAEYRLNPENIHREIVEILKQDYSQTLMISAVLGQLLESKENDKFPAPAFFLFLEILAEIDDSPKKTDIDPPPNVDEATARVMELTTTMVSLICDWSSSGIIGVAKDCPSSLRDIARTVFRRTKLLQSGMWTCVSCGKIVSADEVKGLLCLSCNEELSNDSDLPYDDGPRDRSSYGRLR